MGGSSVFLMSSFPDLVRLFLSLSGPVDQRGVVLGGLLSAAGVTGAGGLPSPAAPVACSSVVPTPGASTPTGAASVTTLLGSLPAQRGAVGGRLVGRGPVRVGSAVGVGPLPLLTLPVRPVRLPSPPVESSGSEGRVIVMPPPPSSRPGAGGGRSESDRLASGRARSS